ncbi:MAG: hypothetical protein SynsKO_29820 [Synoicihabitans sp.]
MARKLRFESEGGLYHVINRGNRRSWVFKSEGAKHAFEKTLRETCERTGWILHAWVIMGNHFHLAVETPKSNLSEGMRWLQSVFGMRYNKFRRGSGHIFQGRFKSIVVENDHRMGWLTHYIHLNPVRAGICKMEELGQYQFGSFAQLMDKKRRAPFLNVNTSLSSAGGLPDTPKGRRQYAAYLAWLVEDESAQKEMKFTQMSKNWAMGSASFRKELVADQRDLSAKLKLGVSEAKELQEMMWEQELRGCLQTFRAARVDVKRSTKAADWKVAIATFLKTNHLCKNGWISQNLDMGAEAAVSRYCSELREGKRTEARRLYKLLC